MTDVEGTPFNPYTTPGDGPGLSLSAHHPLVILKRLVYMGISLFILKRPFNFYKAIFVSPHIRHEWFKIGLASTVALLGVKAYVELFEGRINKKQVNYKNFRQTTHAAIALIIISSLAFNIALWPHYGINSLVVLSVLGFGVILQILLFVPVWLQNILGVVFLTFFLQEYK